MTLVADNSGALSGKFTVPAGLPAGAYTIEATGRGGTRGVAIFEGQGTRIRQEFQQQTTQTEVRWQSPPPVQTQEGRGFDGIDPLAQTFTLPKSQQITGIDLWFSARGTTPIEVQLRETQVGFPTQTVLARKRLKPTEVVLGGASTRVLFDHPAWVRGGQEYALVVACDDPVSALSFAELGKFDPAAQRWVTEQSYRQGVMLSSSNASTWTPHQDKDLAFRLLTAAYTSTTRTIPLGKATVANATDLLLMAYAERPVSEAQVDYQLTLPDGSTLTVDDGQPVRLATPITGDVLVSAILHGTADVSPVLFAGTQLVAGRVSMEDNYITRAVPAGNNVRVKIVYEALVPAGAAVTAQYAGVDNTDAWVTVPVSSTMNMDNGWLEITHDVTGVSETMVRAQLLLTGTSAARPMCRNLRVIVL